MIIGILTVMTAPRFFVTIEQARVDAAGTVLTTVHTAQRIYWLENGSFAPSVDALVDAKLLDASVKSPVAQRYPVTIESASTTTFSAAAERRANEGWSGTLRITETGELTGAIASDSSALPALQPAVP